MANRREALQGIANFLSHQKMVKIRFRWDRFRIWSEGLQASFSDYEVGIDDALD